jgi:hypothetical protein
MAKHQGHALIVIFKANILNFYALVLISWFKDMVEYIY